MNLGSAGRGYFQIDSLVRQYLDLEKVQQKPMIYEFDESNRSYVLNQKPLEYNERNLLLVRGEIEKSHHLSRPNFRTRTIQADEPVRSLLRKFYIALDAYLESGNPVESSDTIIDRVFKGPAGIKEMKYIRAKSFCDSRDLMFLEKPDWYDDVPSYHINDIGDIFNYQYMFDWESPDEEDYKFGLIDVKISKDVILEFKDSLRSRLPDRSKFSKIDKKEILMNQSSSMSLDLSGPEPKRAQNWTLKGRHSEFAHDGITGQRVLVHTGPGTDRDTVILPVDQLNSINLIDRQIHEIIQGMLGNAMVKDYNKFQKKLLKDRSKYSYFLNRDLKKEGITKPHQLIRAIGDVLIEEYPDLDLDQVWGIYNSYTVFVNGEWVKMKRGHGLGMGNSLTTLMQLGVFYLSVDRLHKKRDIEYGMLTCKAFNDDFYAAFKDEDIILEYWEEEEIVCEELSLIREPKKSFSGGDFVLCETYHPSLNFKESYGRREVLNALCCYNIVQAKSLISSLGRSFSEDLFEHYIGEILAYWGYEFCREEVRFSTRLGGWKNLTGRGVSFDSETLISESRFARPLLEAGKITTLRPRVRKKMIPDYYISPVESLYRISDLPEEVQGYFNTGKIHSVAKRFVRVSQNPEEASRLWDDLLDRRKNEFRKFYDVSNSLGDIERLLIEKYPLVDFIPYWTSRGDKIIERSSVPINEALREFDSSNPRMSYLKHLYPDKFLNGDVDANPLPLLVGTRTINLSRTAQERRSEENKMSARSKRDFVPIDEFAFIPSKEEENAYINPVMVLSILAAHGTNNSPIPSHVPEVKKIYIDLHMEYYIPLEILNYTWQFPYCFRRILRDNWCEEVILEINNLAEEFLAMDFSERKPKASFYRGNDDDLASYESMDNNEEQKIKFLELADDFTTLNEMENFNRIAYEGYTAFTPKWQQRIRLKTYLDLGFFHGEMETRMADAQEKYPEAYTFFNSNKIPPYDGVIKEFEQTSESGSEVGFDWDEFT